MTATFALEDGPVECVEAVGSLDDAMLEKRLASHASLVAAETAVFLVLLGEFDARGGWQVDGVRSLPHWLNWKFGTSKRTAQEQVRVAAALRRLPVTLSRFRAGRVSYSQVRAITRVATVDTEEHFLDLAKYCTGAQLDQIVRLEEQVAAGQAEEAATPEVVRRIDEHGRAVLIIKGPVDQVEMLWLAINHATRADKERPIDERRFDGAVAIADAYLASEPVDRSGADRTQVVAHHHPNGVTTVNGTALHPDDASRLMCDASSIDVTHTDDDSDVEVGRNSSGVSASLRRRVLMRDGHQCAWPSCDARHHLHIHHVIHREHDGPTVPSNLAPLCGHHHRLLHNLGYRLRRDHRRWVAVRPDGTTIEPDTGTALAGVPRNAPPRQLPDPDTLTSKWDGTRLDLWWYEPVSVPRNAPPPI